MLSHISKCLVDKSSHTNLSTQFVDPYGSTVHQGAAAPLCLSVDRSGRQWTSGQNWICPLTSHLPAALETVDKSENKRVHRLYISTCGNVKVDKSGRIFSTFYLFFTFFLLYPYLPAIM